MATTHLKTATVLHLVATFAIAALTPAVKADDWVTWASTYTHDAATGEKIDQHSMPVQPMGPSRYAVQRSGYRHYRSTLQTGQSADNLHIVEQWGGDVVPYEQWRFPYRPYGVPYDAWGPQAPYGIFNGQIGIGGIPPQGYAPYPHPGLGVPSQYYDPNTVGPDSTNQGLYPPTGQGYPYGWPANPYGGSRGFPLQPTYNNQPWFDGNYPTAPPLDPRSDREFFYQPNRGRPQPY